MNGDPAKYSPIKTSRRQILKGGALLSLAGLTQATPLMASAGQRASTRFIVDGRLPEAPHIIARAGRMNMPVFDPEGEIIHLLRTPGAHWLEGKGRIIGLTGYSDLMLAQDALREAGQRLLYVAVLDGECGHILLNQASGRTRETLTSLLHQPGALTGATRSTRFIWAS